MKKPQITKTEMEATHPAIPNAYEQLQEGRVTRREFIRLATLLGLSAGISGLAACSGSNSLIYTPPEVPTPEKITAVIRGGTFTKAMGLQSIVHPANLNWIEGSNIVRQVAEYLTYTDEHNVTHPFLLDRWESNEDVTEWTLYLKQGIFFNNQQELQAEDVITSMKTWLDPAIGSSTRGLMSYLQPQNIEKIDDYTIKLYLDTPNIGVPEALFHYPNVILPRTFEGDFINQPIGTGPFLLTQYDVGDQAILQARDDYWRKDAMGGTLPYLDQITYQDLDKDTALTQLITGKIDSIHQLRPLDWQLIKDRDNLVVSYQKSSQVVLLRMRIDMSPWSDPRVIKALKLCQDRSKILELAHFGEGELGIDAHIAPVQAEYAPRPIPQYDPTQAKALLNEAGYPSGIAVTLTTKNDDSEPAIAQALKEMAQVAGFDIQLDITEPAGYWERWDQVGLGLTAWGHRPTPTMLLPLAYTADSNGTPVPWNETRWVDDEFVSLLRQAEGTLDIEDRRELMGQLEDIFTDRGPIGVSFFKNVSDVTTRHTFGKPAHPSAYDIMAEVWKDLTKA